MFFKDIELNSKKELDSYFDLVDYEACEYCFSTLYMWQHVYKTGYYIGEDFAVLVGEYEGDSFSILPLAKKDKLPEVVDFVLEYFSKNNKINKLSDILDELEFSNRQKRLVDNYIDNLKDYGIKPERLKSDTKYMKFIDEIKTEAIQNYKDYKILPSITIAQAIIESSWGKSTLAKQYNNLFGIKADAYWKGKSVTLETKEHLDTIIDDKFRIYDDKNESIKDHAKFLATNKRYKNNGVFDAKTYIYQAKALEKAGYSTAKDENGNSIYAARLIELIQQYNLQLIDSEIQSEM